jgi:hypothetical protein
MSETHELKMRIEAKRKRLEADWAEAKVQANDTKNEAIDAIRTKLDELGSTLQAGWENVTEDVAKRLNHWLED